MNAPQDGPNLGIDIGGTKIAVGVVDRDGKILAQSRTPMIANGTPEAGLQAVFEAIDSMLPPCPEEFKASESALRDRSIQRPVSS